MGKANMDQIAMLLIGLAYQLHTFCMATRGQFYSPGNDDEADEANDSIRGLIILAYIVYSLAVIVTLLINFAGIDNKIIKIVLIVACLGGAVCTMIGVSIYAGELDEYDVSGASSFSMTAYITGMLSIGVAGILILVGMCCKC